MIAARTLWVLILAFGCASGLSAQTTADPPDSRPAALTPGPPAQETGRPVSWVRLVPNILSDQKKIWLFPTQLARGRHVVPALAVVSITAALVATDAHTGGYFRNTTSFQGFNQVFTGNALAIGTVAAPAALYIGGLAARNSYARNTALLAAEAVGDSEILTTVMKDIDQRKRPAAYPTGGTLTDSWFNSQGNWVRGRGSFPSGHTIAAFSIGTVIARRYGRRHRWVPYVAYGLSGLVGFSRMTLNAHFASDVFMGGALGYSIGRFAVLRQ